MPAPVWLVNAHTGQEEPIDPEDVPAALAGGQYTPASGAVAVHRNGIDTFATPDAAAQDRAFVTPADPAQLALAQGHAARADRNAGVLKTAEAFAGGAVSGATAGIVDPFSEAQEFHPIAAGGGQLAGIVLPALVGDEAGLAGGLARLTPTGLIASAGSAVRAGVGESLGTGLAARVAAGTIGGAVEGGLFGAGQGVHAILADDALTWQRAAGHLSSNFLYGAGLGAAGGAAGSLLEAALSGAKAGIDARVPAAPPAAADTAVTPLSDAAAAVDTAGSAGAPASAPEVPAAPVDLSTLDAQGLKLERAKEIEAIDAARAPDRQAIVDGIDDLRVQGKASQAWHVSKTDRLEGLRYVDDKSFASSSRELREAGKLTLIADRRVDALLRVKQDLVENPEKALSALRQQEEALTKLADAADHSDFLLDHARQAAPRRIREDLLQGKIEGWKFGPGGISPDSPLMDQAIEGQMNLLFGDTKNAAFQARVKAIGDQLKANKALQNQIAAVKQEPISARLTAIDAAREAIGQPIEKTATAKVLDAAEALHVPFAGTVNKALFGNHGVLSSIRAVAGKAGTASARAASDFLGATAAATEAIAPLSTRVLQNAIFAPPGTIRDAVAQAAGVAPVLSQQQAVTLPALFAQRSAEIKSQIAIDPTGAFRMTPAARTAMSAQLAGLRAVDPRAADRLETLGARRIEYLASILPRRPNIGGFQIGPTRYQASELEMRSFARSVSATEDPDAVLARAAQGHVVPEEARALQELYPDHLQSFVGAIISNVAANPRSVPYPHRLALSILTGQPLDASLQPAIFGSIQRMYASEPGTGGGTAAPRAQPQFGSVRSAPATAVQQREGQT